MTPSGVSRSSQVTDAGEAGHPGCSTGHTNAQLLFLSNTMTLAAPLIPFT